MKTIILIILFMQLCTCNALAVTIESSSSLDNQMDLLDFTEIDSFISTYDLGYTSFRELILDLIYNTGDFSLDDILNAISNILFNEITANTDLARNILIIGILSGIIKCLTSSRKDNEVSQVSFYATYMVLVMLLFTSFKISADIVLNMINLLQEIMMISLPVLLSVIIMSGNIASATSFNPLMYFVINIIISFIKNFLIPLILLIGGISILNYITDDDKLKNISDSVRSLIEFILKMTTGLFIGILSMQRIITPVSNGLVTKTTKSIINFVPVVGSSLSNAVDTVLYFAGTIKNGVIVGIIIIAVVSLIFPLIKISIVIFMYKLVSALVKPICGDKICKCIDDVSSYTILLLGTMVSVSMIFLYFMIMAISL